jgi:SAM-dependent methyltransferase
VQTIAYPEIETVTDIRDIPAGSVDLVGAFEVLEHVTDDQLHEFLAGARAILKPGGRLLVTVPIMYGLALPLKELTRALLHRRLSDTGPVEMAKATAGHPIARAPNRLSSHKGFDFRWLREKLAADFRIIEESYSPFPKAPWWTNSQAVFIAE